MLSSGNPSRSSAKAAIRLTSATLLSEPNKSACISIVWFFSSNFGGQHQAGHLPRIVRKKHPPNAPVSKGKWPGWILDPFGALWRFLENVALVVIASVHDLADKGLAEVARQRAGRSAFDVVG